MSHEKAVILFGHGSRDPAWRAPMDAVAARIRRDHPGRAVACAFLELQTPDLPAAVEGVIAAGARAVTVVPFFLGAGKHARDDLPRLIEALRQQHPAVAFDVRPAVGEEPRILDLIAAIAAA